MTKTKPQPTDGELAILAVLWERGPSTVREVHQTLSDAGGYTTTLKLMQIMARKGLVLRDESSRTHIYRAGVTRAGTQRRLLGSLVDKAFGGSTSQLVLRALSGRQASKEELNEIRELLDSMESAE